MILNEQSHVATPVRPSSSHLPHHQPPPHPSRHSTLIVDGLGNLAIDLTRLIDRTNIAATTYYHRSQL
ncbi:hypothetical protein ACWEPN_25780 [Nonomuraea wenchangensis]